MASSLHFTKRKVINGLRANCPVSLWRALNVEYGVSTAKIPNKPTVTTISSNPIENGIDHPRRRRYWSKYYCNWCDLDNHNDSRCWFKHPEQAPKWWPDKNKDQIERHRRKNQGIDSDNNEQYLIGNRPALTQSATAFEATRDKVINWQPAKITFEPAKCQVITYEPVEITNQPKAITDEPAKSRETINEPTTVTTTIYEQMENTVNELEATTINQLAQPQDRSGENLPTVINNQSAETTVTNWQPADDELAQMANQLKTIIIKLAEYEIADEPTLAGIIRNDIRYEPAPIDVVTREPYEMINKPAENISDPGRSARIIINLPIKTIRGPEIATSDLKLVETGTTANVVEVTKNSMPAEISDTPAIVEAIVDVLKETEATTTEPAEIQSMNNEPVKTQIEHSTSSTRKPPAALHLYVLRHLTRAIEKAIIYKRNKEPKSSLSLPICFADLNWKFTLTDERKSVGECIVFILARGPGVLAMQGIG